MEQKSKTKTLIVIGITILFSLAIIGVGITFIRNIDIEPTKKEEGIKELKLSTNDYLVELGDEIPSLDKFVVHEQYRNNLEIDDSKVEYEKAGIYTILYSTNVMGEDYQASLSLEIQDTTKPKLTLKNIVVEQGQSVDAHKFVDSYSDEQQVEISFKDKVDTNEHGKKTVTIVARDRSNNITEKTAELIITEKYVATSGNTTNQNQANSIVQNQNQLSNSPTQTTQPQQQKPSVSINGTSVKFPVINFKDFNETLQACQIERSNQMDAGVNMRGRCSPYKNENGIDIGYELTWN